MKNNLISLGVVVGALIFLGLIGLATYRIAFLTFVDNYEFAYYFDARTGQTSPILNEDGSYKHGYVKTIPFIKIAHRIDLRPIQICINGGNTQSTANSRVLNCKLVQFNPAGYETFISWHGRGDYSHNNLTNLLMNYAYDESQKGYPFFTITKELKNENYDNKIKSAVDTLSINQ